MVLYKLVAFFVMFATVVAVAAAVSTLVSGIVNVGVAGMKKTHVMNKMGLKRAAGSAAHAMMRHKMHGECRTEVPFEDVPREEGEHKKC